MSSMLLRAAWRQVHQLGSRVSCWEAGRGWRSAGPRPQLRCDSPSVGYESAEKRQATRRSWEVLET
jgi:hypothetical protein